MDLLKNAFNICVRKTRGTIKRLADWNSAPATDVDVQKMKSMEATK